MVRVEKIMGRKRFASVVLGIEHPKGLVQVICNDADQLTSGVDELEKGILFLAVQRL